MNNPVFRNAMWSTGSAAPRRCARRTTPTKTEANDADKVIQLVQKCGRLRRPGGIGPVVHDLSPCTTCLPRSNMVCLNRRTTVSFYRTSTTQQPTVPWFHVLVNSKYHLTHKYCFCDVTGKGFPVTKLASTGIGNWSSVTSASTTVLVAESASMDTSRYLNIST